MWASFQCRPVSKISNSLRSPCSRYWPVSAPSVEHLAGDVGQGGAGRIRVPPGACGGEAERPGRLAAQDEQEPVDQDQTLAPEPPGQPLALGRRQRGEPLAVGRVVEHPLR